MPDAIFKTDDGVWWFSDSAYDYDFGPYENEDDAKIALKFFRKYGEDAEFERMPIFDRIAIEELHSFARCYEVITE